MVAPIWPEHPQAYWDLMQPWPDVGRACMYVPLGVYCWRYGEPGILRLIMEYLGTVECPEEKCGSLEFWGESGLRADGTDPTREQRVRVRKREKSWKSDWVPKSWQSERQFDRVNPEGYCHRCLWLPPTTSPSVYPLYGDVREWYRSWSHEAIRKRSNWRLVLRYLGESAMCSSGTCWRWVNLPGFRKGIGGEEFAFDVEAHLPLLERELEAGKFDRVVPSQGRCAWCRVPFQCSPTWVDTHGVYKSGHRNVATLMGDFRRNLHSANVCDSKWAEQRWLKRLTTPVVDVRWIGDAWWRYCMATNKVAGGRFEYLYYAGTENKWKRADRKELLLGWSVVELDW